MNNKPIILYVEDEESIRQEMTEILSLDFENIFIAENGQDGLEMYKKHNPDLIITDVQMPYMNGIEMSRAILKINKDAKIIVITAFNEDTYIKKVKEAGIENHINKPVNINELFNTIHSLI